MRIQLIAKPGNGVTGISRYTDKLCRSLLAADVDAQVTYPETIPGWDALHAVTRRLGIDARAFFSNYPLRVSLQEADLYHITTQTMATLLMVQQTDRPVVVTVHDIIPWLLRHNPELNVMRGAAESVFYRMAIAGLKRAAGLIVMSEYTKLTLIEELGFHSEKLRVVYSGVDRRHFYPREVPDSFFAQYGLDRDTPYILYVGSEDPRKNLRRLLEAFALVRRELRAVKLLKVGAPHFLLEHQKLVQLTERLGLREHVLFFDQIPDTELPLFYNVAAVFAMPSLYEGFGLPALEAMACGTAVISSGSGSLPEVVGDAALLIDPQDVERWADSLLFLLTHDQERRHLAAAGCDRASGFTWQRTATETNWVYRQLVHINSGR